MSQNQWSGKLNIEDIVNKGWTVEELLATQK